MGQRPPIIKVDNSILGLGIFSFAHAKMLIALVERLAVFYLI